MLFVRRERGDNGFETVKDLVERGMEPGDRKVAGEHRAPRTEAVDAMQDDRSQAVESPVVIIGHEIGDLDDNIVLACQQREPVAPGLQTLGVAPVPPDTLEPR